MNICILPLVPHLPLPSKCDRNRSGLHTFEAQSTKVRLKAERKRFGSFGVTEAAMFVVRRRNEHIIFHPEFPRVQSQKGYGIVGHWLPIGPLAARLYRGYVSHICECPICRPRYCHQ